MKKLDSNMYKEIGSTLKKRRLEKHMSLDQLVHEINHTKTKSTIKRYEDGVTRIDYDTLLLLCNVLELNINELLEPAKPSPSLSFNEEDIILLFSEHFHINKSLLTKLTQLDPIALIKVENFIQSMTDPINKNYTTRFKELLK